MNAVAGRHRRSVAQHSCFVRIPGDRVPAAEDGERAERVEPARDIHARAVRLERLHPSFTPPVVIDARLKPHMPPPLLEDPAVTRRVDSLFARGGPLWGIE